MRKSAASKKRQYSEIIMEEKGAQENPISIEDERKSDRGEKKILKINKEEREESK
jgi:hypothetical protein